MKKLLEFILDMLFPKFCVNCGREGTYLCQDCFSLIDIFRQQHCPFCYPPKPTADGKTCPSCQRRKYLNGLFCAASYDNYIVKNLINQFKYEPYVKEMSKPISFLIAAHFINLENPYFLEESRREDFILIPVPLHIKKMKQRGYNQAEEIGKEVSKLLKVPLINNVLVKIKETPSQTELTKEEREKNILGTFLCRNTESVKNKKIFLIDDVFTTGSTMEECALTLKRAGAKEVWGITVARG